MTYHDGLFSDIYTGDISTFFSSLGNDEFLIFWLKNSIKTGAIMLEFHFRILTFGSPFDVAF